MVPSFMAICGEAFVLEHVNAEGESFLFVDNQNAARLDGGDHLKDA